ncbi:hypothetical protein Tco_0645628, partial [Tanacetum coccineum]
VDGAKALIMATDALVCGSTIGDGSSSGWEVDGNSSLNRIIAALGDSIWGSGDDNEESGDGSRVGMARSLATSVSKGSDRGV